MARGPLSDGGDCAARRIAAIAIAIGAAFASPLGAQEDPKPAPPPTPPLIPQPAEPAKPAAERMKGELERLRERRERVRADAETALRRRLVPQPMDAARLATLVAAIDPKLASDALLVDGYREYLAAHETIAEDPGRKILQLAPACYVFDAARETFEPRPTPELGTLLALRDTALRRAREAESRLLSLVERLAPGERRGAVLAERVAWAIERSPRTGTLPSTGLTLLELVARLGLDESAQTSVAPLLARYAEDLARLLAARADTLAKADADRARIETEAGALWRYAEPELVVEIERDLAAVDARELAAELAIRDLHAGSLRLLRMRLDPRMGRRLVEQWQRAVHPELFDDELMLSRLAEQVLALPSLGEEGERNFLEALETGYQKLEALGRAACEAADRIPPRAGEASNAEILDEVEARIAVVEAQRARRAALREAILRLRAAAPNDIPEISRRFDDLLATLSAYERADLFDRASLARRADEIARRDADAMAPQQPGAAPTTPEAAPPAPDQAKPATPAKPRGEDATQGGRGGRGSRRTLDGR